MNKPTLLPAVLFAVVLTGVCTRIVTLNCARNPNPETGIYDITAAPGTIVKPPAR